MPRASWAPTLGLGLTGTSPFARIANKCTVWPLRLESLLALTAHGWARGWMDRAGAHQGVGQGLGTRVSPLRRAWVVGAQGDVLRGELIDLFSAGVENSRVSQQDNAHQALCAPRRCLRVWGWPVPPPHSS